MKGIRKAAAWGYLAFWALAVWGPLELFGGHGANFLPMLVAPNLLAGLLIARWWALVLPAVFAAEMLITSVLGSGELPEADGLLIPAIAFASMAVGMAIGRVAGLHRDLESPGGGSS